MRGPLLLEHTGNETSAIYDGRIQFYSTFRDSYLNNIVQYAFTESISADLSNRSRLEKLKFRHRDDPTKDCHGPSRHGRYQYPILQK